MPTSSTERWQMLRRYSITSNHHYTARYSFSSIDAE